MKTNNDCPHTKTRVARIRGSKVRRKCVECGHLGGWERNPQYTKPSSTAVSVSTSPLETMTVPELRERAKAAGITGYSKMTKQVLIQCLEHAASATVPV